MAYAGCRYVSNRLAKEKCQESSISINPKIPAFTPVNEGTTFSQSEWQRYRDVSDQSNVQVWMRLTFSNNIKGCYCFALKNFRE